ncbi:MAG: histidine kinase [Bacteroidota bacterium]
MTAKSKKILFYISRNLLLYLFFVGMNYAFYSLESKKMPGEKYSLATAYVIAIFFLWSMLHNSVLFEKLLLKKKYLLYALFFIPGFAIVMYSEYWVRIALHKIPGNILGTAIVCFLYTCCALILYLAFKYIMERKKFYKLGLMQRDIELQQLKAHLNPHFLFNALNNIYSYTLQHNRYGNELILKLAELMRFILDTSDKNHIKLEEELGFITNYIVFERERLDERCQINFTVTWQNRDKLIAPLILFPFIENACKYGADTIQKTEIDISIEIQPKFLKLIVGNNIVNKTPPSTKTGLHKAIRRLELLYPNKHEVLITTDENKFSVELILQFDEN